MYTMHDWPWGRTLAVAPVGRVLQVEDILFGTVRDRLAGMGIRIGSVLECLGGEDLTVRVRMPDGREERVARAYAWFVFTRTVMEQRIPPWKGRRRPGRDGCDHLFGSPVEILLAPFFVHGEGPPAPSTLRGRVSERGREKRRQHECCTQGLKEFR